MDSLNAIWPEWHVEELIGEGSYGKVYRISREAMGHVSYAAAKMVDIPRDKSEVAELAAMGMDSLAIRDYFEDTARAVVNEIAVMEQLKGARNVVAIEDYRLLEHEGGVGWTVCIRMELLQSLLEYQKVEGPPSVFETVRIGIDVSNALVCCEKRGVIHRDVKPENVFRSEFGEYKLGDFGISRRIEAGSRTTYSQKGTGPYMAPEVVRGERYGSNADIYSLGIMLYRYLNGGRFPLLPPSPQSFTARDDERALFRRLRGDELPEPSGADPALAAIVLRACQADPTRRYRSARELRNDLTAYLDARRRGLIKKGGGTDEVVPPPETGSEPGTPINRPQVSVVAGQETVVREQVPGRGGGNGTKTGGNGGDNKKNDDPVSFVLAAIAASILLIAVGLFWLNGDGGGDVGGGEGGAGGGVSGGGDPEPELLVPGVSPRADPSDYSWSQLAAIAEAICDTEKDADLNLLYRQYNLADDAGRMTRVAKDVMLTDGTWIECQLVATRYRNGRLAQNLSNTGLTFLCRGKGLRHRFDEENEVTWSESELRVWLNNEVINMIPEDLSDHIVLCCVHGGSAPSEGYLANSRGEDVGFDYHGPDDYLWAPSARELGGAVDFEWARDPDNKAKYDELLNQEGEWFTYYSGAGENGFAYAGPRVECEKFSNAEIAFGDSFWLRSFAPSTNRPLTVNATGDIGYGVDADEELSVVFCFSLGECKEAEEGLTHYGDEQKPDYVDE